MLIDVCGICCWTAYHDFLASRAKSQGIQRCPRGCNLSSSVRRNRVSQVPGPTSPQQCDCLPPKKRARGEFYQVILHSHSRYLDEKGDRWSQPVRGVRNGRLTSSWSGRRAGGVEAERQSRLVCGNSRRKCVSTPTIHFLSLFPGQKSWQEENKTKQIVALCRNCQFSRFM